ncbi:hypothetical protein HYALB_00001078 [Hymenoscyphus albidus]|uniref:Uncharacterized protein n=1 Tax=Hymenoscyphus albidus TaxID=595503 RepID=A0A9N9LZX5_9HELO|nr:hypothetical protein HYALB_00001078 [Hymenoscyphus albidus]
MGPSLTSVLPPDLPYRQPFMIQVGGYVRDGARESEQRQMLRFESTAALADIWGERNDPEALQQERAEWQREQKLRIASWETRLEETTTELSERMEEQRRDLAVLRRLWADLTQWLRPWLSSSDAGDFAFVGSRKKEENNFALRDTIENLLEPGEYGVLAQVGYIWRERRGDVNAMRMVLRARGTWTSSLGVSQRNFSNLRRLQDDIKTAREKYSLDLGAIRQRAKELVNIQLKNESQAIAERAQERARDIFTRQQPAAAAAAQQQPGEQRADGQPDLDMDADIDQQLEVAAQELDAEEDRLVPQDDIQVISGIDNEVKNNNYF